jgi:hypothetical protein
VARWWEDVIQADGTLGRLRRSEVIGTVRISDAPLGYAGSVSEVRVDQQRQGATAVRPYIWRFRQGRLESVGYRLGLI